MRYQIQCQNYKLCFHSCVYIYMPMCVCVCEMCDVTRPPTPFACSLAGCYALFEISKLEPWKPRQTIDMFKEKPPLYPHLTPPNAPSASLLNTFRLIALARTDTNPTSAAPTTNPSPSSMTFTGPGSPPNVSWNR